MKYCLKWNNISQCLNDADEISIKYIEDKGLVDFMNKYAGKRIIIRLESTDFKDSEIAKLTAIRNSLDFDFTVGLPTQDMKLANKLKAKDIPFYFLTPVKDWETLNFYITEVGVSDIDISGPLGFDLPKVTNFLARYAPDTIIRATPNALSSLHDTCPPLQKFFIRPNDIDLYEQYIDVLEFEGIEHQDTFYKIYSQEKIFIGKLSQVIYDFPLPIDNMGLITAFSERRIDCGRQCLYGGRCKRCMTLSQISEKMGPYVREKVKENLQKELKEKFGEQEN